MSGAAPDDGLAARYYRTPLATRAICSMNVFFFIADAILLPVLQLSPRQASAQGALALNCGIAGGAADAVCFCPSRTSR
jgi:hypothetical protein